MSELGKPYVEPKPSALELAICDFGQECVSTLRAGQRFSTLPSYAKLLECIGKSAEPRDLVAIAKEASEGVAKNTGTAPQLAFAPILFALQDAEKDGRL